MTDKQIIIEDCPHFIGGCCQEYLDGVCENHKCDLKIIRELEQKLKAKEQECEELKETFDGLFKVQYKLADNNKKLRQCLTEIKEIAEINPINTCWTVLELCEKCDENKECDIQCPLFKFKLILQKISEVEE